MKYILISFIAGCLLLITPLIKPEPTKKEIAKKLEVPILCYHRIRPSLPSDGKNMRAYSVTPAHFAQQMKALHDNGFHTILPEQLYQYLVHNKSLPKNPVMITFDDTREEHFRLGAAEMSKYGFKGAFFIMTISMNRPGYMTKTQIKTLSDKGNCIGVHTWDHNPVTKYQGKDWDIQVIKPKKQLESITGKPVNYFAYPSGIWNKAAIPQLKSNGYQLAFILSTKSDPNEPLYTVRRLIVDGSLSAEGMLKTMKGTFNK